MTASRSNSNCKGNYAFYDENFKPMWKRGISRKIGESAFVQQTLPTYRLSWSPLKICPCLLLMGALFTGMGVGILKFADGIQEVKIPYTNCTSQERRGETCYKILENATNAAKSPDKSGTLFVDATDIENCTCYVRFQLKEPMKGKVYIYYSLINFYQNHLKSYASRDENQLKGNLFKKNGEKRDPSTACDPMDYFDDKTDGKKKIIYPCGIMANSMFTDVIDLTYHQSGPVPLLKTGIAWESDRHDKYDNPDEFYDNSSIWLDYSKPFGWKKTLWQLDPSNRSNNGVLNEDFIVWMRAAAFPWFRKLHRIVDIKQEPFQNGLPAGNYTITIQYNFDVSTFNGKKEIILTTSTIVGGKNMFLAIVYMATGGICIFLSFVLFIVYKLYGVAPSQIVKAAVRSNSIKED